MTVTLYVNWGDRNLISESEMLDMIAEVAETEINDFSSNFVDYIDGEFTTKELFELTEEEQNRVKDRYRQLCITEWLEDYICLLGYEITTVEV